MHKIHKTYSDVSDGSALLLFNSSKFLEIAINRADKNAKGGMQVLYLESKKEIKFILIFKVIKYVSNIQKRTQKFFL